jgi:hypothetical protein
MSNLVLCTPLLWRRDGRLLHDLASGTHVTSVRADEVSDETLTFKSDSTPLLPTPISYGRFIVDRILHESSACKWYEGIDPGLDRLVWIAVRPASAAELTEERRALASPGQPRWIGSGCTSQHRWDAFLGVDSISLAQLEPSLHGMSDLRSKKAFWELVSELAHMESTQRLSLSVLEIERFRIGNRGSIVRLDDLSPSPVEPIKLDPTTVFSKLKVLSTRLFGIDGDTQSKRSAPMALHLKKILDRIDPAHRRAFPTLTALLEELRTVQLRPVASNFRTRMIQIATQSALSIAPFGAMLALVGTGHLLRLDRIENELLRLYALQEIRSGTDFEASWQAIQESVAERNQGALSQSTIAGEMFDRELSAFETMQQEARKRISGIDRQTLDAANEIFIGADLRPWLLASNDLPKSGIFQWSVPSELPAKFLPKDATDPEALVSLNDAKTKEFLSAGRIDTQELASSLVRIQTNPGSLDLTKTNRVVLLSFLPWITLIVWGCLWRGGISRLAAGLVIVNESGKPAGWLRIFFRSALLWAP